MEPFVVYLLVGIVIVLLGFLSIRKGSQKKNRCTASASAVIVEVQAEKDEAGSENTHKKFTYTPIYEFVVNGNTIRKNGGIYSHNKRDFNVGEYLGGLADDSGSIGMIDNNIYNIYVGDSDIIETGFNDLTAKAYKVVDESIEAYENSRKKKGK